MKTFVFLALLCSCLSGWAQNLVPNPSFELYSVCPNAPSQTSLITDWDTPPNHTGSSDYFNSCVPTSVGVPGNIFGNQAARTGNAYAGGFVGYLINPYQNYREYLQCQLTAPLVAGSTYRVEAYISLPENVNNTVDRYGFYLSNAPLQGSFNYWNIAVNPQIESVGTFFTNTTGWDLVGGTFVASGGEQYLTIGNFRDAATTNVQPAGGSAYSPYLYVDDVRVEISTILSVSFSHLAAEYSGGFNRISWATSLEENLSHFVLEKSQDGAGFNPIAELAAGAPNGEYLYAEPAEADQAATFYRLRGVDFNGDQHFSQTVELKGMQAPTTPKVYPTRLAVGEQVWVEMPKAAGNQVDMQLYDSAGNLVQEENRHLDGTGERIALLPEASEPGIYLLKIHAGAEGAFFRLLLH